MAETPPLDVTEFLTPITSENPAGEYLRWEDDYAAIESAREEDDEIRGVDIWKRARKLADWESVIALGRKVLKGRSKDLQVAAWVAEGMVHRQGLAGLRDGLRLILALQETFWTTAHPESGDQELREGVYDFLDADRRLPLLIRGLPVTEVIGLPRYSFLKFKESRDVENILRKTPEREEELSSEGKIRAADFDAAAAATDRSFYEQLVARVGECQEAVRALNASIKAPAHYGPQGPTLSQTAAALEDVASLVKDLIGRKGPAESPEPEPEPEPERPDVPAPSGDEPREEPGRGGPTVFRPKTATASRGGPIAGPADARARIADAAHFLREADAADPTAYLVLRALGMGTLYRLPARADPSQFPAPASEDRQALRQLAADGSWTELLTAAEHVLARPEGTAWLDAHRYAIAALNELRHDEAARAAEAIVAAELRSYPELPGSELSDGTPTANAATREWLNATFPSDAPGPSAAPVYVPEKAPDPDGDTAPDPGEQAQRLLNDGQPLAAIAAITLAVREAKTGRDRFLRTLQQAELCLSMGRPGVAAPLLEGLARQVEDRKLEDWEDPTLCARVVASLYRCLRGQDANRARAVYQRLCQLDIGQALSFGEDAEPNPPNDPS